MKRDYIPALIILILILAFIIFYVYVIIRYADTPVDEVPYWVIWFLYGGSLK